MLESKEVAAVKAGEAFYNAMQDPDASLKTFTREEIDPTGSIEKCNISSELMKSAGVGPLLISALPLQKKVLSGTAIYRKFGRSIF